MRLKKDKSGDTVGRPSCRSSLLGDPGAKFFSGKPQHMKNSLNFANTCLKVVDTRRDEKKLSREKKILLGVGIALFVLVGISLLPWTPGQAEGAFRPVTRLAEHFLPLAIFGYLLLDRWLRHKR